METQQTSINSGFDVHSTPEQVMDGIELNGRVAVVTGGHSGIGLETTRALANAGAMVIVGARNPAKAKEMLAGLANVEIIALDLADPASVNAFAVEYLGNHRTCNILVNNAGIMATPLMRDSRG